MFLMEKHPKSELNFHQCIQIRKKITLEISLYQDRLPLWVFHISSCEIYLNHDISQPHLIVFYCFFL